MICEMWRQVSHTQNCISEHFFVFVKNLLFLAHFAINISTTLNNHIEHWSKFCLENNRKGRHSNIVYFRIDLRCFTFTLSQCFYKSLLTWRQNLSAIGFLSTKWRGAWDRYKLFLSTITWVILNQMIWNFLCTLKRGWSIKIYKNNINKFLTLILL